MAILVLSFQGTWALAGTTGGVSGYVLLQDNSPLAGASVSATSPSESTSTTTDPSGHFVFVSLIPDTYVISASKDGYDTVSQAGVTVIADNMQTVSLKTQRTAAIIGHVVVRAANELVKPGTTADVYSVNATQASKLGSLGGGGGADTAYSAIAAIPGALVPPGQQGWYQTIHLRGGDYDQVGYEYDGIPVNRAFDNYPSSTASNLGQNEVQVYTGAAPQNAEGQGLSGFINQVLKNGSYPGFASIDAAVGGPALYNKFNLEIGGGTPDRRFTYYVATGGYQASPRLVDNANGSDLTSVWGPMYDIYNGGAGNTPTCPFATASSCAANYANMLGGNLIFGAGGLLGGQANSALIGPAGYVLGAYNYGAGHTWADRENVVNVHIGLPHARDSGRDDIQLMYSNSLLVNPLWISTGDWNVPNSILPDIFGLGCGGPCTYVSGYQVTTPPGTVVTTACPAPCGVIRYAFPSSGVQCQDLTRFCAAGFPVVPNFREDGQQNGQGIFKVQYQHNIGSTAFLRIYGYSYYSWWFLYGPVSTSNYFVGTASDYELTSHTRGVSAEFQDQITTNHLITAQVSATTATTRRDNNTQMLTYASGSRRRAWVLVDAANPYNGLCYTAGGAYGSCQPDSIPFPLSGRAAYLAYFDAGVNGIPAPPSVCGANFASPCAWLQAESGPFATYNDVTPKFYAASLGDQWKPSDKLLINLGIRFDSFGYYPGPTNHGAISGFWLAAWNSGHCISAVPGSSPVDKMTDLATYYTPLAAGPITPLTPCSAISDPTNPGHTYLDDINSLNNGQTLTYTEWQPRFGLTYTMSPDDVIRASYGKYAQAPNTAFEYYNTLQQNNVRFFASTFNQYGRMGPSYTNGFETPEESWNADLSWEHRFGNSDTSFKLTPFYRQTNHQVQTFFLDQKTSFVSGFPIGKQTADGVELQLQKGDFSRDGFSGLLSYTYTWTTIKYGPIPSPPGVTGAHTALTTINNAIMQYNAYTSFCAANPADPRCGLTTDHLTATPCYTTAGLPDAACAGTSVANPYWNAPVQSLFNPSGSYLPTGIFPGIFNSDAQSFAIPNVATLVLNWKHDKLSITPALQYFGEGFYGDPLQTEGIDPATNTIPGSNAFSAIGALGGCNATLATGFPDPRYPFGPPAVGTGGAPYDATSCNTDILIPDPFTGKYDSIGAFRTPQQLVGHLQISYEATPRVTYVAGFNNLLNTCWGGSKMPWTLSDHRVCTYSFTGFGNFLSWTGNFYNPDSVFQRQFQYPYIPVFGSTNDNGAANYAPLQMSFEVKVKL